MPPQPIALTDPRLAEATKHPTRVHILSVLNGRSGTCKGVAKELGCDKRHVDYHMKKLLELDCVEVVHTRTTARGVEHEYTATRRPVLDTEAWDQLDDRTKREISVTLMRLVSSEIAVSMEAGTFFDPDDNHISRMPMTVDPEGWKEVNDLLDGVSEELIRIQERCRERGDLDTPEALLTRVMMVNFRHPTAD